MVEKKEELSKCINTVTPLGKASTLHLQGINTGSMTNQTHNSQAHCGPPAVHYKCIVFGFVCKQMGYFTFRAC